MPMPNRQIVNGEPYRYGYQGEFAETDEETGKPSFQLRIYDPRINRWLSPDPYGQYDSPYMSMDNHWNMSTDPTGGCTGDDNCSCGGNGQHEMLNEVVINGKSNNFTGYELNTRDWQIFDMLKIEAPNLHYAIKDRFDKGEYFQLGGGNWGGFAPNWEKGGAPDNVGRMIDGMSITFEIAIPINLEMRDHYPPLYGYAISFGTYNNYGTDEAGNFFTHKVATTPGLAYGVSIDAISFENLRKNASIHSGLAGHGYEVGGNLIFGYSKSRDISLGNPHNAATLFSDSFSLGVGIDVGYSEWDTFTRVYRYNK
ncbi:hypothetical protein TSEDIMI_10006 [Tenacibaculum sediminilitoris]|uniref:RHS repeat-associated core domain-containing protein n=1 Tax=Tenacibaculum sediminilitoris TaxID=1820334 RepID=UPI00389414ED